MSNFAFVQAVGRPEIYVYGQITEDGMNVMRASATNLCPRNLHLFYD